MESETMSLHIDRESAEMLCDVIVEMIAAMTAKIDDPAIRAETHNELIQDAYHRLNMALQDTRIVT